MSSDAKDKISQPQLKSAISSDVTEKSSPQLQFKSTTPSDVSERIPLPQLKPTISSDVSEGISQRQHNKIMSYEQTRKIAQLRVKSIIASDQSEGASGPTLKSIMSSDASESISLPQLKLIISPDESEGTSQPQLGSILSSDIHKRIAKARARFTTPSVLSEGVFGPRPKSTMSSDANGDDSSDEIFKQRHKLRLLAWTQWRACKATCYADIILQSYYIPRQLDKAPTLLLPHLDASEFILAEEDNDLRAATGRSNFTKRFGAFTRSQNGAASEQASPKDETIWLEGWETCFNLEQLRQSIWRTQHTCRGQDPRLNKLRLRPCRRAFCHVGATMGTVEDTHTIQAKARYANLKKAGVVRRTNRIMATFEERLDYTAKHIAACPNDEEGIVCAIGELQSYIWQIIPPSVVTKDNEAAIERKYGVDGFSCDEMKEQIAEKLCFLRIIGKDKSVSHSETALEDSDIETWNSSPEGEEFEKLLDEETEFGWQNPAPVPNSGPSPISESTIGHLQETSDLIQRVTDLADKRFETLMSSRFEMLLSSQPKNQPVAAKASASTSKPIPVQSKEKRLQEAEDMLNEVTNLAYRRFEKTPEGQTDPNPGANTDTEAQTRAKNDANFEALSAAINGAMAHASTGPNHLKGINVKIGSSSKGKASIEAPVGYHPPVGPSVVWDPSTPFPEGHYGNITVRGTVTFEQLKMLQEKFVKKD